MEDIHQRELAVEI